MLYLATRLKVLPSLPTQGFASALTELLGQKKVEVGVAVDRALQETAQRLGKGPEERDRIVGRLLVCASVIRSGVIDGNGPEIKKLFEAILDIRNKKSWIRQAATEVALSAAEVAPTVLLLGTIIPLLVSLLVDESRGVQDNNGYGADVSALDGLGDMSPDQIQVALGLHQLMKRRSLLPYDGDTALPQCLNQPKSVICKGVGKSLVECVRISSSTFPRMHLMWPRIWDDLGLSMPHRSKPLQPKALQSVLELWKCCVDDVLTEGSHNQKGYALLLVRDVVQRLPPQKELVEGILSHSMVRVLVNHSSNPQSVLHSLARSFLSDLPQLLCRNNGVKSDSDEEICQYVVGALIKSGGMHFDSRSGTRVVASLLQALSQEKLEAHSRFLSSVIEKQVSVNSMKVIEGGADVESEVNTKSVAAEAAEALYILSRTACTVATERDEVLDKHTRDQRRWLWFNLVAPVFVRWGLMAGGPNALAEMCKQKLFAIVADTKQLPEGWGEVTSLGALYKALSHWAYLESTKGGGLKMRLEMREETRGFLKKVLQFVSPWVGGGGTMLGRGRDKNQEEKLGMSFAAILMHLALYILAGAHHLAQQAFDLFETYEMLVHQKVQVEAEHEERGSVDGDGTDPIQVLIDILLAILGSLVDGEKREGGGGISSRGLRDSVKATWVRVLSNTQISEAAMRCLMSAVCTVDEANALGLGPMKQGSSVGSDTGSDISDEGNEMEDSCDECKEKTEGDEGGNKEEHNSEEDEEENVLLDAEGLEDLLQGEADENEEEADALSALIEARYKARGGRRVAADAANAQVHLQLHALDLLEVVVSRQRSNRLLYSLIQPIAVAARRLENQSTRSSDARALRERLLSLLRKKLIKCKPACNSVFPDMGAMTEWFILECGRKGLGRTGLETAREAALFCLKMTQHGDEDWERGKKAVISALVVYMNRSRGAYAGIDGRVFNSIVTHLQDFDVNHRISLLDGIVPVLVEGLRSGKTLYLRADAARLFRLLLLEEKKVKNSEDKSIAAGGEREKVATADSLCAVSCALKSIAKIHGGQGEGAVGRKAKHTRPMLQCAAAILRNLIETRVAPVASHDLDHLLSVVRDSAAVAQEAIEGAHVASLSSIGQEVIAQADTLEMEIAELRQGASISAESEQSTKKKKRKHTIIKPPYEEMDSGKMDKMKTIQKGNNKKKRPSTTWNDSE